MRAGVHDVTQTVRSKKPLDWMPFDEMMDDMRVPRDREHADRRIVIAEIGAS
jgi:hypothetical protein